MKLTDLKPEWGDDKMRIEFDCPRCRSVNCARVDIPVVKEYQKRPSWDMTGDSFENLTLRPSVDFTHHNPAIGPGANCNAHFFITEGEVRMV